MRVKRLARPFAWSSGALLFGAGVAVLLWPPAEVPRKTGSRAAFQIPLKAPKPVDPRPSWPELARVKDLETKKDDATLARIALTPSDPEDRQQTRLRVTALYALGNVGTPAATAALRGVLEDAERELVLRMTAAAALARSGGDAEVSYLRNRLAAEPSRLVREKIRMALEARGS